MPQLPKITWAEKLREWQVPKEKIQEVAQALRAIKADPIRHGSPEALTEYIAKVRSIYPAATTPFIGALEYLINLLFNKGGNLVKGSMLVVLGAFSLYKFSGWMRYLGFVPVIAGAIQILDYFGVIEV